MKAREIEAQAAVWLIRLDGDRSPDVRAEFTSWLSTDPRCHASFLRLEKGWKRADRLKNLRPLDGEINANVLETFPHAFPPGVTAPHEKKPRNTLRLALAASAVAAALIVGSWVAYIQSQTQVYRTDRGGFQRIALADGSTAVLNTNSEIRVHLTKERRQIELRRGEALFTVAHDAHRPFDVKAGDTVVRAVGTAFSVRLNDDQKQVDVIVTEGRVAIDPPDDSQNLKLAQSIPLPIPTLAAGHSVKVSEHKVQVQKIDDESVTHKLAWVQGRLWFDRVTLAEAVAEFNRYNKRQLVIDDPSIAELKIGGTFDATDVDSFVAALETFGIRAVPTRMKADDADSEVIRLMNSGVKH